MVLSKVKVVLLMLLVWLLPLSVTAQKKQISQARDNIKNKKELDKAEKSMRSLLEDSVNRTNHKIWITLINSLIAQYEQGNESLYLKQKYDTAALFNTTKRMFQAMESFDSLDVLPDKKGRVEPKFRQRHAELLNAIRPNLYYGGVFFVVKKDYKQALSFMEEYMDSSRQPLFGGYGYAEKDTMMPHAAYWAMYAGSKLNDADVILRYKDLAEKDTARLNFVLQYATEAYDMTMDRQKYVETLRRGFYNYPTFPFFFPRLVEYYQHENKLDSALAVTETALEVDSVNVMFLYAKSTILLNLGRYDECIELCKRLIAKDDSLAGAYYNIGLAYFNQAIELDKVQQKSRTKRQKITQLYEKSLPYLEKYRLLAPDQKSQWISPLYTIYLNLNKGKEFDEIDKINNEYKRSHK